MTARLRCEVFPRDLDAAVGFYVGVLAFEVERDERRSDHPYVALRRGTVLLGAAPGPDGVDPAIRHPRVGVELVLEVEDLDAEYERVQAAWTVEEPIRLQPWGLRDFRLTDPDGYYWRITDRPQDRGASTRSSTNTGIRRSVRAW